MIDPRVEVWDPSSEGPWITERLRQEGFDVENVALADVILTRADLVLMAGDAEGALPALKLLRDEGTRGDVPVILLGLPDGMLRHSEGPAFGADALLARPVEFDPLLRCVRRLLGAAEGPPLRSSSAMLSPERTMRLPGEADVPGSQVFALRESPVEALPWRPREPTLQLGDRADDAESSVLARGRHASSVPPRTATSTRASTGTGSRPGTGASSGPEVPEPLIPPEARADLSPWLHELLRTADRRVFPDRSSLVLHFPAAMDPPDALVPPELLEISALRTDEPVVDDPIDAFTYVGGPAMPSPMPSGSGSEPPAETPRESRQTSPETPGRVSRVVQRDTPVTGIERPSSPSDAPPTSAPMASSPELNGDWPRDDTVLGRSAPDGSRRGTLGRGGAIRLLWRIAALRIDGTLELACDEGPSVRMTFLSGELRALGGPVAQCALAQLRRRGRASEQPADEAGAEAVLKRRVELGDLGRFERDRLMREAREHLLEAIVRSASASFTLRRLEDTQPGRVLFRARVLARSLRAALVEAARVALRAEEVLELLGIGRTGVALGPEREAGLAAAELAFELCELLVRMEGCAFSELLAAAPTEVGLAGVLYALVAGDVLVLTEAPRDVRPAPEARASARALLETAIALGDDGDYFAILGLAHEAGDAELERTYRARRHDLASLPLGLLDLGPLEARRQGALDAVEEAYRALSDPRRRASYAAALQGS